MAILDKIKKKFSKKESKPDDTTKKSVAVDAPKKAAKKSDDEKKTKDVKKATASKTSETKKHVKQNLRIASKFANVLKNPHITEKSALLAAQNKYIFEVDTRVNKKMIAHAVQAIYNIKPTRVSIINMRGKVVRFGKIWGTQKNYKKAIVTLPKGKTLDIYEGV